MYKCCIQGDSAPSATPNGTLKNTNPTYFTAITGLNDRYRQALLTGFENGLWVPGAVLGGELLAAYRVPAVLYHFTSAEAAAAIAADGTITASAGFPTSLFGAGVYGSSSLSPFAAGLMGAGATDAAIAIPTAGLTVTPTLVQGSFVISGNVTLSSGVTILF